ncbi:glycosyltransferase family 2 protein [Ammoniphilus sp. CFH 90114]|uniref:glycosyltransferase family 2 protein n=1 Tax=Ammoniphilus sp. CFH 90114 TaxID=2493665 RepID=UPI00100E33A4|nr:glycosyltransferase family 2 protein [Ammoniphilus sp. CFH 90114]RXT13970.1 glycosyltransferase family 2 protein [Ammoniphilus sp. CFH 90114]
MTDPTFTVVIPSYNRADFIEDAIQSVIRQTYKHWKLLIIDDASTDDTVERVEPYLSDERIRLIPLKENIGISQVMNRALKEVETEAFIQLDSDDWLEKDTLKQFSKAMKKRPKAVLVYGNIRMWHEKDHGKWKAMKIIRHRQFSNKYEFLTYMTYMLHPRCYRTESVRKVGGWEINDAYNGRIMEDRRMVLKLIERYPVYWIDRILYNRRKHRQQLTNKDAYQARNHLRKELVYSSLRRWGNRYSPVFGYRAGLLIVKKLRLRKNQKK